MVLRIVRQLLKIQMALDDPHSWTNIQVKDRGNTCEKFLVTRGGWGWWAWEEDYYLWHNLEEAGARQMPY